MAQRRTESRYREFVDGIYQVSVSANKELYGRLIKEEPEMCEALKDLLKDELKKEFMATEARGEISGAIKIYHEEMGLSPSEIEMNVIRAIIEARTSQNLTQKELSERTGIAQTEISRLENGTRNPSIKLLQRLADGMGMVLNVTFTPK